MARVLKGSHSFYLHTSRSSTNGMNHTCLCLPSRSWYSFTDPGGMEGWVGLESSSHSIGIVAKVGIGCTVGSKRPTLLVQHYFPSWDLPTLLITNTRGCMMCWFRRWVTCYSAIHRVIASLFSLSSSSCDVARYCVIARAVVIAARVAKLLVVGAWIVRMACSIVVMCHVWRLGTTCIAGC